MKPAVLFLINYLLQGLDTGEFVKIEDLVRVGKNQLFQGTR